MCADQNLHVEDSQSDKQQNRGNRKAQRKQKVRPVAKMRERLMETD